MFSLSQERMKRLVSIHGWSGTILGLLLYCVVLTGAVAVFAHEIGAWSQGGTKYDKALSDPLDRHVRAVAENVDPKFFEELSIYKTTTGFLKLSFHTHEHNPNVGRIDDYGVQAVLNPQTGEVLDTKTGFSANLTAEEPHTALERFLVDLHVRLYVPEPWGLILTGILGLLMMSASISGILMHKHLFRDIFVSPRNLARLVGARDRHVLIASWSLPFSILLGFTGAFFSFALSVGLPIVAMVAFGGDQRAMIETLVGHEEVVSSKSVPVANLDAIIAHATKRNGTTPVSVTIENFGAEGSKISVNHPTRDGDLTVERHVYDGVTGTYVGVKPRLGKVPSTGATAVGLMGPLHFGNFAGLASKATWFALGLGMAFVIATGMQLWVKRRENTASWQRFGRVVTVFIWGLPLALLSSAISFFLSSTFGDPTWWTPVGFVIGCISFITLGLAVKLPETAYRLAAVCLCVALPAARQLTGGPSWLDAFAGAHAEILVIDMLLLSLAVHLALPLLRKAAPGELINRPAE